MMKALGMVEVASIPNGIKIGDAMLKAASVELVFAQAVCAGKYIAVVSGDVAAVEESVRVGTKQCESQLIDSLVLSTVHEDVFSAINACSEIGNVGALGVMETFSLCAAVIVADAAAKAADIKLIEVRLGRGLGGKAFITMTGEVSAVESAIKAAQGVPSIQGLMSASVVIPSPHTDIVNSLL